MSGKEPTAAALLAILNRRTGFLLHLSPDEKARLKAAAGDQPLAAWIREVALEAAESKQK